MHSNAFQEMNIVILGDVPILPMKLEQHLSKITPNQEVLLDSFESYDQAYDFCKGNKNVGLIFIIEDGKAMDVSSIFNQLSQFSSTQETCYGVILHQGQESFMGLRSLKDTPQFISYCDANDFLDLDLAPHRLKEIWEQYQTTFQTELIPNVLASTYRNIALSYIQENELNFQSRVCNLLSSEFNLSWKESFILKWYPILKILKSEENKLLASNETLYQIFNSIDTDEPNDIEIIAEKSLPLAQKVSSTLNILVNKSQNGNLEAFLNDTTAKVSPRSKALLRILKRNKEQILEFSKSVQEKKDFLKVV